MYHCDRKAGKKGIRAIKSKAKALRHFNPIPAGVLENQDMLGGVNLTPPPLNPMFYIQI